MISFERCYYAARSVMFPINPCVSVSCTYVYGLPVLDGSSPLRLDINVHSLLQSSGNDRVHLT